MGIGSIEQWYCTRSETAASSVGRHLHVSTRGCRGRHTLITETCHRLHNSRALMLNQMTNGSPGALALMMTPDFDVLDRPE